MFKKIKNTLFLLILFIFVFFLVKFYFSEKNIKFTNKSRSSYSTEIFQENNNLPLLKNDTNNIMTYTDDIKKFNEKRKKRFWERLLSKDNE